MSLHAAAQHLASKGRNGDTTLVHMTKGEVAGLQAVAKKHGTSMTINPHTGLPEAFSLKSLIPIAAGLALGPAGMGIASSAMGAGLMVGGATALGTGSLKQGLIAGLGAYGGAGLGEGIAAGSSSITGPGAGGVPVTDAVATPVEAIQAGGSAAPATQQYAGAYQPTSFSSAPTDLATEVNAYSPTQTNYGAFGEAPGTVTEVQPSQYGAFGEAPPTSSTGSVPDATQQQAAASYGNAAPVSSSAPAPTGTFDQIAANAEKNPKLLAYAAAPAISEELTPAPYQPEEYKGDTDMGQRLGYESGYDNSVPGRTGQARYTQISGEEAKRRYGFADGGDVGYPGEPVVRMADGGAPAVAAPSAGYEAGPFSGADYSGYAPGQYSGSQYSGYDAPVNAGISAALPATPGVNPNQRIVDLYAKVEAKRIADEAKAAEEKRIAEAAAAVAAEPIYYAQGGGISTLGGYSDGGRLLRGPGDGVSDSIPAVIGKKQPARLADGEFVVPARIVSEIGNGSTEAGARKLYAMMDRVQKARGKTVGKGKVAKNTRADKYLPA
jgi:hypothetical protein